MKRRNAIYSALGILTDMKLGEPPIQPHPLSVFAKIMRKLEHRFYSDSRLVGLGYAVSGGLIGTIGGLVLKSTTCATYFAVAQKSLCSNAIEVARMLEVGDLDAARDLLPSLVGRDPTCLDEKEIARAVVESVAENSVDAIVAPAIMGFIAGAPGALCYRAINTMDAMVGYRNARYQSFGWASARMDDIANFVPARLAVLLVALVRPGNAGQVWRITRRDGAQHPSPNSGVVEAAFAASLGIRLGGSNSYNGETEVRPSLGDGRSPEIEDIYLAVDLCREITLALAGILICIGIVL